MLCPAGNLPALKADIDIGANAVYIGSKDGTNKDILRFKFHRKKSYKTVNYVHRHQRKLHIQQTPLLTLVDLNTGKKAVDMAASLGAECAYFGGYRHVRVHSRRYHIERHVPVGMLLQP